MGWRVIDLCIEADRGQSKAGVAGEGIGEELGADVGPLGVGVDGQPGEMGAERIGQTDLKADQAVAAPGNGECGSLFPGEDEGLGAESPARMEGEVIDGGQFIHLGQLGRTDVDVVGAGRRGDEVRFAPGFDLLDEGKAELVEERREPRLGRHGAERFHAPAGERREARGEETMDDGGSRETAGDGGGADPGGGRGIDRGEQAAGNGRVAFGNESGCPPKPVGDRPPIGMEMAARRGLEQPVDGAGVGRPGRADGERADRRGERWVHGIKELVFSLIYEEMVTWAEGSSKR